MSLHGKPHTGLVHVVVVDHERGQRFVAVCASLDDAIAKRDRITKTLLADEIVRIESAVPFYGAGGSRRPPLPDT